MQLSKLVAQKILNSRGEATIAVLAETKGITVKASAPSGASKGKHEVQDFSSKGIDFSIALLNEIGKKLKKISFEDFEDLEKIEEIVRQYDQTARLELIGGNALYALEAAVLKAMAASQEQQLWQFLLKKTKPAIPRPIGNCIGGGLHVRQKTKTDWQEFLLLPKAKSFSDSFSAMQQAYKEVKKLISKDQKWQGKLTDENAFAVTLDNESTLMLLVSLRELIEKRFEVQLELGIDCAASTLWNGQYYSYKNFSRTVKEKKLTAQEQNNYIIEIAKNYQLVYLEDPFHDEAFNEFAWITKKLKRVLICGDDLICTKLERLEKAIRQKAISAVIIKPNQVGSLLETKKVIELAKKHEIACVISHRSGETQDSFIADLAVGWQIPFIKAGIVGKERLAKLHRLVAIEQLIS